MEDKEKQSSMEALRDTEHWVIWKTKDDIWTHTLNREEFHQILSFDKDTKANSWGQKIKGWWRRGDIKATIRYSNVG